MLDIESARQIIKGVSCDAFHIVEDCCYDLTEGTGFILERIVDNQYAVCIYASGTASAYWGSAMKLSGTLSLEGIKHGLTYRAQDTFNDPRVNKERALIAKAAATLVVPLCIEKCNPYGVLKITSVVPEAFEAVHVAAMDELQLDLSMLFKDCFCWN